MPELWDAEVYRQRAERWQEKADKLTPGVERDACVAIAKGYADLAELLAKRAATLPLSSHSQQPTILKAPPERQATEL